jgi:hypothetical protein
MFDIVNRIFNVMSLRTPQKEAISYLDAISSKMINIYKIAYFAIDNLLDLCYNVYIEA